jgi:hypothetical protein
MSSVGGLEPCALCGAPSLYDFYCRTSECSHECTKCGFGSRSEEKTINGQNYWVETAYFPIAEDGKVRRPEFAPFWDGYRRWSWGKIEEWICDHLGPLGRRVQYARFKARHAEELAYHEKHADLWKRICADPDPAATAAFVAKQKEKHAGTIRRAVPKESGAVDKAGTL